MGLLVALVVLATYALQPTFLRFLDDKLYDTLLESSHHRTVSGTPIVIDIDEKSLEQYGQWPWPRYRVADLLGRLKDSGVKAVGFDMIFAEPDRTSFLTLKRAWEKDSKRSIDISGISETLLDNDRILASTLSRGPFVMGYEFRFDEGASHTNAGSSSPLRVALLQDEGTHQQAMPLFRAKGVVDNLPLLTRAASSSGFLNAGPDMDGVIRRVPLLMEYQGEIYPSLALATFLKAYDVRSRVLRLSPGSAATLLLDAAKIPLDANGCLMVHYRGKGRTFPYLSAADVLNGRVPRNSLEGRIAFLGTSASGLNDLKATPMDPVFPSAEIHATVMDNLLQKDFLSRPFWAPSVEVLFVLFSAVLCILFLCYSRAPVGLLLLGCTAVCFWGGSLMTLRVKGIFLSPLYPLISLVAAFALLNLVVNWQQQRKLKASTQELLETQEFTIQCLAALAETGDTSTGGHIERTQLYMKSLCRELARHPRFSAFLTPETIESLRQSAPLHDIGKVGVPDRILLKPAQLDAGEFEVMKEHVFYGMDAIARAEDRLHRRGISSFLSLAKDVAYSHHEMWNGTGYPKGLKGDRIPPVGRIMAVVDVYDALVSKRVYRPAFSHEEALRIIASEKGGRFDPDVVEAFLKVQEEFREIAAGVADV